MQQDQHTGGSPHGDFFAGTVTPKAVEYPGGTAWQADASTADVPLPAARPRRAWWQSALIGLGWLRIAGIGLAVGGGIVGYFAQADRDASGAIAEAGELAAMELRVGDCFDRPEGDEVVDVAAVPCGRPHDSEVFALATLTGATLPSYDATVATVEQHCLPAFQEYVGRAYRRSELDISWLSPTEGSWSEGDRTLTCIATAVDGSRLNGSVKGSRR